MKKSVVSYYHSKSLNLEIIYSKASKICYPEHNHTSKCVIGLVVDGTIELILKNKSVKYNADDVFVILPYEPHAISSGDKSYSAITICLEKFHVTKNDMNFVLPALVDALSYLVSNNIIALRQLEKLLNTIVKVYEYDVDILTNLDITINTIREILETMPESEMTLEGLLRNRYISKYHFIRKFKRFIGLTPHQFQIQNRIRKAQRLITKGNSITQVALDTGFYDQSHFNRCFKRIVGITPSEYLHSVRYY